MAKRRRASSKGRRVRRRKAVSRRSRRIGRARSRRSGFPLKMVMKMKYAETITIDPTPGLTANHLFRATSIFDPNFTGLGHQPLFHDEMSEIYNHYRVLKSKIVATFVPVGESATNGTPVVGIRLTDDGAITTSYDGLREQNGSHYKVVNRDGKARLSHTYNSRKWFPGNVPGINAPFGSNPTEEVFFQLFGMGSNTSSDFAGISVIVTIYYTVMMWEPRDILQS